MLDAEVEVSLLDDAGDVLHSTIAPLALGYVAPGEAAPFSARFTVERRPASAHARLVSYVPSELARADISASGAVARSLATSDGRPALLVEIGNPLDQPVRLAGMAVLFRGGDGRLAGIAGSGTGLTTLSAGQSTTWLLVGEAAEGALPSAALTDARMLDAIPEPSLAATMGPTLVTTDQGTRFVVGEISNTGGELRWARAIVTVQTGGEVGTLAAVASPIPLRPGERLAFALTDFLGLAQLPGYATASLEIDPLASEPAEGNVALLSLEIIQLEQIGSSLFARGTIENRTGSEVLHPSVLAAVHATDGKLLSAGWATPQERLASSETVEFRFQIPLPAGFDIEAAEFDWRALGLAP